MNSIKSIDKTYVAGTYNRFDLEITSGKGSIVFDGDGKSYIDMGSGIGVTSFGISDDIWKNAVIDQLNQVQHMSNLYYTSQCALLAKLLCEKTGLKKVFFANSGCEANECAIKVARKYAQEHKGGEYSTIITLNGSFHGRTITTLAATGQEHYHKLFTPLTEGFVYAPNNNPDELISIARSNKTAAIMIECIQGEGGVIPLEDSFVKSIAEFAKNEDILLIVDEVQTGNGRTGKLYSYMNYGISPDIITTAKGLGGGLPIGATILGEKVKDTLSFGDHGSTFGGNPVCCAGALSILNRIDDDLLFEVNKKSKYIFKELENAKGVEKVSGMGLMIGIKTKKPAIDVVNKCMQDGVLCLTAKDKVRLLPALNIPFETLKTAVEIIKNACAE